MDLKMLALALLEDHSGRITRNSRDRVPFWLDGTLPTIKVIPGKVPSVAGRNDACKGRPALFLLVRAELSSDGKLTRIIPKGHQLFT